MISVLFLEYFFFFFAKNKDIFRNNKYQSGSPPPRIRGIIFRFAKMKVLPVGKFAPDTYEYLLLLVGGVSSANFILQTFYGFSADLILSPYGFWRDQITKSVQT